MKENEAAEHQLAELKAYAEAITQEIVEMVALLEKTKGGRAAWFAFALTPCCSAGGRAQGQASRFAVGHRARWSHAAPRHAAIHGQEPQQPVAARACAAEHGQEARL